MSLSGLRRSLVSIKTLARATSAMRVLSMSSSSMIKTEIDTSLNFLTSIEEIKKEFKIFPKKDSDEKILYVFVGSEKGLCGSYNNELKIECKKFMNSVFKFEKDKIIFIGKKLINSLKKINFSNETIFIEKFSRKNLLEIKEKIILESFFYSKIIFYYINSKTLFSRSFEKKEIYSDFYFDSKDFYLGNFKNENIINNFLKIYKSKNITFILKNALYSEESSRFISMDAAYTNAKKIIKEKEVIYNKIRQSTITNSSLDLISNWIEY